MKEPQEEIKAPTEIVQEQQAKKESLIGYKGIRKGMKVWEYNTVTGEIGLAEIGKVPVPFKKASENKASVLEGGEKYGFKGYNPNAMLENLRNIQKNPVHIGKIVRKPGCFYCDALNFKNAVRKFGFKNAKITKVKPTEL